MGKLMEFQDGKKTYLVVAAATVVFVAQLLGLISSEAAATDYTALGLAGAATLRDAVKKIEPWTS